MLSLKRYGWLCVLGAEVAYVLCWLGGLLPWRSGAGTQLHHAIFETMPGVAWGTFGGFLLGAVYMFVFAWVFAWYYVWMHNTSIQK